MIWVSTCFNAHAVAKSLHPIIFFGMLSQLLLWRVWNIRTKNKFPPFPLPHSVTSWYYYHWRQLLVVSRHCHSWFNLPKYGASSKSFLVIAMLISYYIGMYSSSLPHIATSALLLLINLWQTTPSSFTVFYFICVLMVSWLLCFLMACVFILLFSLYFLWLDSHPYLFIYMIFLLFLLINHI
jgi:hypothetical protein